MTDHPRLTADDAANLEEILDHKGYAVVETLIRQRSAEIMTRLTLAKTDWDEVNRLRGELRGLGFLAPKNLRNHYPESEKP